MEPTGGEPRAKTNGGEILIRFGSYDSAEGAEIIYNIKFRHYSINVYANNYSGGSGHVREELIRQPPDLAV